MSSRNRQGKRWSEQTLSELAEENIFPLKEKVPDYPYAKFTCQLCAFYFKDVPACRRHFTDIRHERKLEIARQNWILENLAPPPKRHLDSLDRTITDICEQVGLCDQDLQERQEIVRSVQMFLAESIPGVELRVYGSSLTGFGLKTSDLNINLVVPDGSNPAHLLTQTYNQIDDCDTYTNVKSNFSDITPSVVFDSPCGKVRCEISVNSDLAYYTSRLLAVYAESDPRVRQLVVTLRHWAKVCQVDDQQKGSLPAYTFGLMTVFYLQQCRLPVLPVRFKDLSDSVLGRPKTSKDILKMLTDIDGDIQKWRCQNDDTLGRLWLDLLFFYGIDFNITDHVVSIRQEKNLLRSDKKWSKKCIAVEDPFSERNVARTLFSTQIFEYMYDSLRESYLYFSLPTNQDAVLSNDKSRHNKCEDDFSSDSDEDYDYDNDTSDESESDFERQNLKLSTVTTKQLQLLRQTVTAEYNHVFTTDCLTADECPPIICSVCEIEGHLNSQCPEEQLPEKIQLEPVTQQHVKLLTRVVNKARSKYQLSVEDVDERESVRQRLEDIIQRRFSDARCSLFGSSKNGFGFQDSDLDVCLTFDRRRPDNCDFVDLIQDLYERLKSHRSFEKVIAITTAKVPILQFTHKSTGLEGDISLYNMLALQNTELLYCYSCIDPRVVALGYAIKVFAKECGIGDASKGSLSSYAYMLLMFHYLQHTSPPVIPVLQELRDDDEVSENMIDGWNAWYYDDIKNLRHVWPDYKKNTQSVGELWLGFFRYYTEDFNVNEQIVTIRQYEPLTKFEKLWNGKCLAIEDPFILSHNLGVGLTRKMHNYIMSALIKARELYGTSVTRVPDGCSLLGYFFDAETLTEGDVPKVRLCRECGKIGHNEKECPVVSARKQKEAEKRTKENRRKSHKHRDKQPSHRN